MPNSWGALGAESKGRACSSVGKLAASHPLASSLYPLFLEDRSLCRMDDPKPTRRRKPPTQLIVSEQSKAAMRARLDSEEGQRCLDELAKIIAEWSAKSMPPDLLQALVEEKGHATLKDLWPEIVTAFFKACSNPAPRKPRS